MAAETEIINIDNVQKSLWDDIEALGKNISGETLEALLEMIESGGSKIVKVPFTLTVTQGGTTGSTEADLDEVLTARANGKIIVAAATLSLGSDTYYYDGIMSQGESGLESSVLMINAAGTKLEVLNIKWSESGVTVDKKEVSVS